jgi:hypothetical protein
MENLSPEYSCRNECSYYTPIDKDTTYLVCCCYGDMCNRKNTFVDITTVSYASPTITAEETQTQTTTPPSGVANYLIPISVSTLTVVGAAIAIVLSCMYRRRRNGGRNRPSGAILDDSLGCPGACQIRTDGYGENEDPVFPPIDFASLNMMDKIGDGRFSQVWKAGLNGYFVAVKIFPEKEKHSWETEHEAYTDPTIRHDNLLRFLTAKPHADRGYWMILEYHELGSLTDYLIAYSLTIDDVSKMAMSVAAGLAYLHSEVCGVKPAMAHRDVKSMNVLVKKDLTCCICDLGLSIKFRPGTSLTEAHRPVGTIRYMAPEILEGAIMFSRESLLRVDVYALGLVIWELISRCSFGGVIDEYKQPFEEEVGLHPKIQQMREVVVHSRTRPKFRNGWDCMQVR